MAIPSLPLIGFKFGMCKQAAIKCAKHQGSFKFKEGFVHLGQASLRTTPIRLLHLHIYFFSPEKYVIVKSEISRCREGLCLGTVVQTAGCPANLSSVITGMGLIDGGYQCPPIPWLRYAPDSCLLCSPAVCQWSTNKRFGRSPHKPTSILPSWPPRPTAKASIRNEEKTKSSHGGLSPLTHCLFSLNVQHWNFHSDPPRLEPHRIFFSTS